jgi:hypothetical protein
MNELFSPEFIGMLIAIVQCWIAMSVGAILFGGLVLGTVWAIIKFLN